MARSSSPTRLSDFAPFSVMRLSAAGRLRVPSSIPSQSRSPPPNCSPLSPVAWEFPPTPTLSSSTGSAGAARVAMATRPPEKSPGRRGEKVFWISTFSSAPVGNMSMGITRRVGSGLGSGEPLNTVFE